MGGIGANGSTVPRTRSETRIFTDRSPRMLKKNIPVADLKFGMYVAELDRSWTDTPFTFQGFILETEAELETLKKFCKTVFVDEARSESRALSANGPTFQRYKVQVPVERETVEGAKAAHATAKSTIRELVRCVRTNKAIDANSVEQAVTTMMESVLRNPDALMLFSRLREKDDYTHAHSLDTAVYMTSFGRFLQLPVEQISLLCYVGLMQDVGKLRIPSDILTKRERLTPAELELAQQHVQHSVDILRGTPGLPAPLPELAALHHERHGGSGYPAGLKAEDIGMIGSIAGIADTFDALTAERPYANAVSPSTALSMLYKWRGSFFDAALVEQFIRCIGIFPLGSVVEFNSGEVGIVIAQNPDKRLQPRVMVVRDAAGADLRPQKLLDLSRAPKTPGGEPYCIKRTLEYGKAGVNADTLFLS
jgi:HD-GYP domain-containing protein (c-di-GMP phosphodiesterase class II)